MLAGIAFRPGLRAWLAAQPRDVGCLELRVDEALAEARPSRIVRVTSWPRALHAPQLSLGTPGPLDPAQLERVVRAARTVHPLWIGAYLGYRHRPEPEACYPQPLTPSGSTLAHVVENCRQLIEACARPVLLENVTAFGATCGSMSHGEFLNRLCDEAGCRLLVDVTALTVDARFGFDCSGWLREVEPCHIAAVHLGGWKEEGRGRWGARHEGPISEDAWALARELIARSRVGAAIVQCDGPRVDVPELQADLRRLAAFDRVPALASPFDRPALAQLG